jgi:2-oxo-4-hydroxy-4-carboxy--5-ureidoimidazoline (OHCU) decarboxylase
MANEARAQFARAVEEKKKQLLSAHPELSELAAFRMASDQVAKENSGLLTAYRKDSKSL